MERKKSFAIGSVTAAAAAAAIFISSACACAETPTVYISPSGSDAAACTIAAPCLTMNHGYAVAAPGAVVEMAGGTYAAQPGIDYISGRTSPDDVTIQPASGATVSVTGPLGITGRHLTINDVSFTPVNGDSSLYIFNDGGNAAYKAQDITIRRAHFGSLLLQAADDISILDSDIGPSGVYCPSCTTGTMQGREDTVDIYWAGPPSGARSGAENEPERVLLEGNTIHDAMCTHGTCGGSGSHSDGFQVSTGGFVTVRRNKFSRTGDQSLVKGDQGPLDNIVIENNMFDAPGAAATGENTSGISLQISGTVTPCTNCVVRNNTFNDDVRFDAGGGSSGTVTGNLIKVMSTTTCSNSTGAGFVWAYNAFGSGTCGTNPFTFSGSWPAAFVNSTVTSPSLDLHLNAGAEPLGKASPSDHPASDIDLDVRPSTPDAGADER